MSDDYPSTTSTTGTVAVDGSKRGEIETNNDADWFQVILDEGRTYQIDVKGSPTGNGTLDDPKLIGIRDLLGRHIVNTGNDDGGEGLNSQITFTAPADGAYFVAVDAYEDNTGTYKVSVKDVTDTAITDDFAATKETDGAVAVDGSVRGEIGTSGDHDWFAVDLTAGTTYQIDLKGLSTGDGTLWVTYLAGVYTSASTNRIAGTEAGGGGLNTRLEFTPTETRTHYVSAAGYGSDTGTYRLSVSVKEDVPIVDDHSATRQTTGEVDVDGSVTGEIETANDRDWFKVELDAGQTYRIDLKGSRTGAGTLVDPYLYGVYDANGNYIPFTTNDDGGAGSDSRVEFTPTATGAYYVEARDHGSDTGAYTLSVTDITDDDDYSATRGTTGAVTVDGAATGEIDYGRDRDWFEVELEAGKAYEIDLEGSPTGEGTLRDPYLRGVYNANGNLIAGTTNDDGGAGRNSRVEFTAGEDATYYVAAGAYANRKGTYKLSVTEVPDDFAAATGTTGAVAVGGSATGEIDYRGDRDWFEVALDANKIYRIDLKGSRTGDGTLSDPFLRGVYDADGDRIAGTGNNNGGAGRNSRVEFTPTATDTYYVAAGAYGTRRGDYTLTVVELAGGRDDFAASKETTGAVAVGGSTTGEIERSFDLDWFRVDLVGGRSYQIDLEGSVTWAGTLEDPYLHGVYDSDGDLISGTTNDDDGVGYNSRVDYTPTDAGTYYVAAGAYGGWTGDYTLSVTDSADFLRPGDDYVEWTGTTGAVAVGGSATGDLEKFDDRDWFRVNLDAGTTYQIDLKGFDTGDGTLVDPYLYGIHNANGVLISGTTNDDVNIGSLNSRVIFTPVDAGTYYVEAGGVGGAHVGTYTLSVTASGGVGDDYAAGTGTTGTVTVGESVTGVIEFEGDRDWFAVELDAGKTYQIDLKGSETGGGTLGDPYLEGIHHANGDFITGTEDDDGGEGANSRVTFMAPADATYYVVAAGFGVDEVGTYTLSVVEEVM